MSDDWVDDPLNDDDDHLPLEILGIARRVFVDTLSKRGVTRDESFSTIFAELDLTAIQELDSSRSVDSKKQAVRKLHGDWFEWLLCDVAEQVARERKTPLRAVKLPNATRFDSFELYEPRLRDMLVGLRHEVQQSEVELISSNPDFVLVSASVSGEFRNLPRFSSDLVQHYDNEYIKVAGRCGFDDIKAYLAAKYTLRPDRRLQMAHEGSLKKALYVHLQTTQWITDPPGLKMYAVTSKATKADRRALKTVATHSITTVASAPQRAVDELFEVRTIAEASEMFFRILGDV